MDKTKLITVNIYIDGKPYLSDVVEPNNTVYICGKYFGSSTRIGCIGSVFVYPDYINKNMKITETSEGKTTTIFDGEIDVKGFVETLEKKKSDIEAPDLDILEEFDAPEITRDTCYLGAFAPMKISENISVYFRDLHRFNNEVEISGICYTRNS